MAKKTTASKKTARKTNRKGAGGARTTGSRTAKKAGGAKREALTRSGKDLAYAKRRDDGTFKEIDEVGRSLAADRPREAKTKAMPGYGDQGDR